MASHISNIVTDDGQNLTINYALALVNRPALDVSQYKIKELGLHLTLIGLAEVNAARVANLASKLYLLEREVFNESTIRELEPKKIIELYKMIVEATREASEYVSRTIKSTDWSAVESQLLQLSMEDPDAGLESSESTDRMQKVAADILSRLNLNM